MLRLDFILGFYLPIALVLLGWLFAGFFRLRAVARALRVTALVLFVGTLAVGYAYDLFFDEEAKAIRRCKSLLYEERDPALIVRRDVAERCEALLRTKLQECLKHTDDLFGGFDARAFLRCVGRYTASGEGWDVP